MKWCPKFKKFIEALLEQHGLPLVRFQPGDSVVFQVGDGHTGMMPLVISLIGKQFLSVRHYYEQNGDYVSDPEVVFFTGYSDPAKPPDGPQVWVPIEIQHPPPLPLMVYVEFNDDYTKVTEVRTRGQADLATNFVEDLWRKNLESTFLRDDIHPVFVPDWARPAAVETEPTVPPRELQGMGEADFQELVDRVVDWYYLTVEAGNMATKSDCEVWLMAVYDLSRGAAHEVTNFAESHDSSYRIGDGQITWVNPNRSAPTSLPEAPVVGEDTPAAAAPAPVPEAGLVSCTVCGQVCTPDAMESIGPHSYCQECYARLLAEDDCCACTRCGTVCTSAEAVAVGEEQLCPECAGFQPGPAVFSPDAPAPAAAPIEAAIRCLACGHVCNPDEAVTVAGFGVLCPACRDLVAEIAPPVRAPSGSQVVDLAPTAWRMVVDDASPTPAAPAEEAPAGDLAERDLFRCKVYGVVDDIDNSTKQGDQLVCPACAERATALVAVALATPVAVEASMPRQMTLF